MTKALDKVEQKATMKKRRRAKRKIIIISCFGWRSLLRLERLRDLRSVCCTRVSNSRAREHDGEGFHSNRLYVLTSGLFSGRLCEPFHISCFTKIFNDYVSAGFFIKYMINIYYFIQINNGRVSSFLEKHVVATSFHHLGNQYQNASLNEQGERGRFQNTVEDLRINIKIQD